ncbi:MAG: 16S rRNA (cytidine(1402)-2'-O)-methyltransferase [Bacillaceae bacterium]|nr:16S rRNA (cytidine(1402)-2'-O)-methyltransferase [Bacillaceae bacterium]
MNIQKSFEQDDNGKLYIVPTPIGNLEDITFRALETLKTADLIAAEDTRQTKKLLNHFSIATPLVSFHEHNKTGRGEQLLTELKAGKKIALVSDAGMPLISDPGYELVNEAGSSGIDVVVLPGANAALCALVGSGLPTQHFLFYGFLPRKKKEMKEELLQLQYRDHTMIFYESPHRIKETIKVMTDVFGSSRNMALARELTKRHEEYVRGTAGDILTWLQSGEAEIRGEFCVVVEGTDETLPQEEQWWQPLTLKEHVDYYMQKNYSSKDAIKQAAKDRGIPKREVYQAYHRN